MPMATPIQPSQNQGVHKPEKPKLQRLWLEVFPRKLGHQEVKRAVFGWLDKRVMDSVPTIMAAETYAATHRWHTTSAFRITKGKISVLFVSDQPPYGQKTLRIGTIDELGEEHQRYEKSGGDPATVAFFFGDWQKFCTHPLLQPQARSIALQQPQGQPASYSQRIRDINIISMQTPLHNGLPLGSTGIACGVLNASASEFVPRRHPGTASPPVRGVPGVDFPAPVAPRAMIPQQNAHIRAGHGGTSPVVPAQAHKSTPSPPEKTYATTNPPWNEDPDWDSISKDIQAFSDAAATSSQTGQHIALTQTIPGERPEVVQTQAQVSSSSSSSSSPEKTDSTLNSRRKDFSSRTSPSGGIQASSDPAAAISQQLAEQNLDGGVQAPTGPSFKMRSESTSEASRIAATYLSAAEIRRDFEAKVTVDNWPISFTKAHQRAILRSMGHYASPNSTELEYRWRDEYQGFGHIESKGPLDVWKSPRFVRESEIQHEGDKSYILKGRRNPYDGVWETYKTPVMRWFATGMLSYQVEGDDAWTPFMTLEDIERSVVGSMSCDPESLLHESKPEHDVPLETPEEVQRGWVDPRGNHHRSLLEECNSPEFIRNLRASNRGYGAVGDHLPRRQPLPRTPNRLDEARLSGALERIWQSGPFQEDYRPTDYIPACRYSASYRREEQAAWDQRAKQGGKLWEGQSSLTDWL